jgi:hypothetical protein
MAMPVMLNVAPPPLVNVTVCGALMIPMLWLPKLKLVGKTLTPEAMPVPVRFTVCGLPLPLSVTVRVAVRTPAIVGVNVTLIVQLAPAASVAAQLLVCAKSLLFVPAMAIP